MRFPTIPLVVIPTLSFFGWHLFSSVEAQIDGQNYFVIPQPPGPNEAFSANAIWRNGSTQSIRWITNYQNYTIKLWQQDLVSPVGHSGPTIFSKADDDKDADQFDWVVQTFTFDLSQSDVFFLWLTTPGVESLTSHYFNITKATTSFSSDAPSSSSTSPPVSLIVPTIPLSSTSQTSQAAAPTAINHDGNEISRGTKIGIGVGVGFGLAILALLGAVLVVMLKKKKKRDERGPPPAAFMEDEVNRSFPGKRPQPQAQVLTQEMQGNEAPIPIAAIDKKASRWSTRVELE